MILTHDETAWADKRITLTPDERACVDETLQELSLAGATYGVKVPFDMPAIVRVEAALIRLIIESR
jgi:hypothetical protein